MNKNLIASRIKERYESLDETKQRELDNFFSQRAAAHQLKVIKRSNSVPKTGDIFIVSPREGHYFYGRVMVAGIVREIPDSFVEGQNVVFIFKCHTTEKNLNNYIPDYNDLLIPPAIVSLDYWKRGYFYTLTNIPLTYDEENIDFGFYKLNFRKNFFCKETGEVLEKEPKLLGGYGITTITGIASEIGRELIIDPSLLGESDSF